MNNNIIFSSPFYIAQLLYLPEAMNSRKTVEWSDLEAVSVLGLVVQVMPGIQNNLRLPSGSVGQNDAERKLRVPLVQGVTADLTWEVTKSCTEYKVKGRQVK